jgi:hypothetical protein
VCVWNGSGWERETMEAGVMQPEKTGIDQERAVPGNRIPTAPEGVFGLVELYPSAPASRT